jgi:amphi-Trp domain-containing protein
MSKHDKREIRLEGDVTASRVAELLRTWASGLEQGEILLEHGLERIVLRPVETLALDVRAKIKKGECSLRFEIEWDEPSAFVTRSLANAEK